ncbi:MAG: tRNA (N6-threonylcarbamoyladenosine(37)-N6)-methyltransferase TrmO [Deltaproteobacteria bacterium]|nr:tRNA (N6-threonylcarbamoyladenosine(37)-N6)-methyltransferase TrmO [Deltaproteobacteria bacterium]
MNEIVYRPIGVIRTPYTGAGGMPIQPRGAVGVRGHVEVLPEYVEGLRDLEGFSHIYLLYHLHASRGVALRVVPFLDDVSRGVFATRAPRRPNALGQSVVRLREVRGCVLHVENVDMLDGTPLLDIKPYAPVFDHWAVEATGWLGERGFGAEAMRSDERFVRR